MTTPNAMLQAACNRLSALGDGRKSACWGEARAIGGRLGWTGSPSRTQCEDELVAATGGETYRSHIRRGLANGARKPLEEPVYRRDNDDSDTEHIRPRKEVRHNELVEAPTRDDRSRTWAQLAPIEPGGDVEAYLIERGINPDAVRAMDLARELPRGAEHRGMSCGGVPWAESGNRLVVQLVDANGRLVNMMGRRRPIGPKDNLKTLGMGGVTGGAHIQTCPTGRALLAGRAWAVEAVKRRGVVVPEGEFDVLTYAQRGTEGPVPFGGKHWSQEHADRLPDGTNVWLRPHNDAAGRKIAHKVAASLYGRCNVYAPPLPLWGDDDDNDRHNAEPSTLPAHPREDSDTYYLERDGAFFPCVVAKPKEEIWKELRGYLTEFAMPEPSAELVSVEERDEDEPETVVIDGNLGVGKTYAQVRVVIVALLAELRVRWAAPTDKLIRETLKVFRKAADEMRISGEITATQRAALLLSFAGSIDVGRNPESCSEFNHVGAASRATRGGGGIVCSACEFKSDCARKTTGYIHRKRLRSADSPYDFTITTHAMEALQGEDADPVDLLVIDESPASALIDDEKFSAAHLAQWFNAGDLGDLGEDAKNQLLALLADSESQKGAELPSSILDGADLGEMANTAARLLKLIKRDSDIASKHTWDSIRKAPSWRALAAFRDSARRGFKGCRVEKGEVVVQYCKAFRRPARRTVILDATSTPQLTAALFGNSARIKAFRCIQSPVHVTHLKGWTLSNWNALEPKKHADTWRRWNEVYEAKVDAKTLVILTKPIVKLLKSMGEDAPPWFRRADALNHVLYFGAAESRGSNIYEDCERVLVLPCFVPGAAIASRAAVLANIAEVELKPDDDTWTRQARYEIETSTFLQTAGRARSRLEIIIMGGERTFGFTPDESVHVDLYAWRECLGTFCPSACLDEFTRLKVAMRGGATVLSVRSLSGVSQGIGGSGIYILGFPRWGETPSEQRLTNALKDVCGNSTVYWAERARLGLISVRTSGGVRRIAYTEEHGEPTTETVRRELLAYEPELRWFQLEGDEARRDVVDPIAKYDAGIIALARAGEELSVRNLARASGVPDSTTGRACKRHGAAMNERHALAVEAAKVPKRKWQSPRADSVDLKARARSRVRSRVPPKWHEFLQEHGYLIGRVPTSRGVAPRWEPRVEREAVAVA